MLEKITKIIQDYKQDENLEITEDTTFSDLALDSLDTVEIVMNLEEQFGVTIDMDEEIKTVGDLIRVMGKK
jgi:acyl carrier protein